MIDFNGLPQEIVFEIFAFVPEYGYKINKDLHKISQDAEVSSIYCDFIRYCPRCFTIPLKACIMAYVDEFYKEDIQIKAKKYLNDHIMELLYMHLSCENDLTHILDGLGITNADRITQIEWQNNHGATIYEDLSYRDKVINLYSLIVLRDNGLLTRQEFVQKCDDIQEKVLLLEIIFTTLNHYDHAWTAAIRHLPEYVDDAIEYIHNWLAVDKRIVNHDAYQYKTGELVNHIRFHKVAKKIDRSSLRNIRDQILSVRRGKYEDKIGHVYDTEVKRLIFLIESLADDEE